MARSSRHDVPCELTVNGAPFQSVQIRNTIQPLDDFDVVIRDNWCGEFSLHQGFDLKLRKNSSWHPVTLAELKQALREREFPRSMDVPNSSGRAELRLFSRGWVDEDSETPSLRRMDWITTHDRCVRRVRAVLGEVAIPCVPCALFLSYLTAAVQKRFFCMRGFSLATLALVPWSSRSVDVPPTSSNVLPFPGVRRVDASQRNERLDREGRLKLIRGN